jgi:hypothetical protein
MTTKTVENAYGPLVVPAIVAAIVLAAASVAEAQDTHRGVVRVEFGNAAIHGRLSRGDGVHIAARLAYGWQDDRIRLEAGIIRGTADDGFTGADVGMELRGCPRACRVVPWLAVALGGINDRLGAAPMARLSLGLDVKLSTNHLLRVGLLRSTHGKGSSGPNGLVLGFSRRIG